MSKDKKENQLKNNLDNSKDTNESFDEKIEKETLETEDLAEETTIEQKLESEDLIKDIVENEINETQVINNDKSNDLNIKDDIKNYLDKNIFEDIKTIEESDISNHEEYVLDDEKMNKYVSTFSDIAQNQIINGTVIGQNEKEIIMDIGFKSEGIIPRTEFSTVSIPDLGENMDVYLEKIEDKNGQTILSVEKAVWMKGWMKLMQIQKEDKTVMGKVIRRIKGGVIVDVEGIQAFLPGSQIDVRPVQDFDNLLGKELEFKIVKINQLRKNVVLSRKALLSNSMKEQRDQLFENIEEGQIMQGVVKNITDFGVFVDLGGLDGLLHITDLSWGRVNHPSEITSIGETINVKIIEIDLKKQRISLGLKQLVPHPWDNVEDKFPVGSSIKGKVVSLTNYGAFVELDMGVEGLVHVSEMSWTKNIRRPDEVVQLGQEVEAQVLSIDLSDRKIALGFKQLQNDPWQEVQEKYEVGSTLKGDVRNLTQFGAFVELEDGIDGLIHVSDLSWTKNINHPKEILKKGDNVEVKVLEVSKENHRIALGLKQMQEDPWDEIKSSFSVGNKVDGKLLKILDKGLIFDLDLDTEGIIKTDEMSDENKVIIKDSVEIGQTLECKVVDVNQDDKKIILSFFDEKKFIKKIKNDIEKPSKEK